MTDALTPTDPRSQAYVLAPGEVRRNPTVHPGVKADSTDTAGLSWPARLTKGEKSVRLPGSSSENWKHTRGEALSESTE